MSAMTKILLGGASAIALAGGVRAANAQSAASDVKVPREETLQTVVVTGTRIQNPSMTSPTPLTVLSAEQFRQTAPSSADDIINQLPAFRPSSGPNQVQRNTGSLSTGQSLANLRGLGSQRTLTLIDGQRPVPTNAQGTTSTSIVPVELIESVAVVTGGASAAYGSDAVAGVTNFVLKDRIDGIRGSVYSGRSQRGDNEEVGFSIAGGLSLLDDRLSIIAGGDYNKNDGVGNIYSRSWSKVEPGNSGNPISFGANRPAGMAAFGWANGVEYATQTPGGVINSARTAAGTPSTVLNQLAFAPDGSTYRLARGPVFGNLMINSSSNPTATPLAQWQLKQPLEQLATMARVTYDFTDRTTGFLRVGYARSELFSLSQYHQTPTVTILANNPYLPAQMTALMAANNIASFDMGRVDTEWFGTTADNTSWTLETSAGLRGSLTDRFNWDLSYGYGKSILDSTIYGTREANLAAASYAVLDASGNIVCGPIATNPNFAPNRQTNTIRPEFVQPGCVPLNPFGAGSPSPAARAYVAGPEYTENELLRHNVAVNVSGQLFDLPAGSMAVAAGLEYRRDSLAQRADALQELGVYSCCNYKSYSGRNNVKEGYAEVEVPLLKDMTAVQALGLNAAIRRTDYQTSGAVTTWKFGATYEPVEDLRFRVTRSRDIRAPSLSELFLIGGVSATGSFVNPFNGQSARLPQQTTGNADLVPETANTFAVGATYQAGGARFSVDYYKIEVEDVIASVGATDILARCYQGNQIYCSAIQFDNSVFGISKILVQPFNQSLLELEGLDLEIGYRFDLEALGLPGSFDAVLFATHTQSLKTTDRPGPSGTTIDNAGVQAGLPKWVASAYLNYRLDPITIGLQARTFSPVRYSALFIGPGEDGYDPALPNSINKNTFASKVYINVNGTYRFTGIGEGFEAFVNVANLFDREPPEYAIAAINLGGNPYDYIGRTFKAGVRFSF